jgi:S1-C subfamily serine protease
MTNEDTEGMWPSYGDGATQPPTPPAPDDTLTPPAPPAPDPTSIWAPPAEPTAPDAPQASQQWQPQPTWQQPAWQQPWQPPAAQEPVVPTAGVPSPFAAPTSSPGAMPSSWPAPPSGETPPTGPMYGAQWPPPPPPPPGQAAWGGSWQPPSAAPAAPSAWGAGRRRAAVAIAIVIAVLASFGVGAALGNSASKASRPSVSAPSFVPNAPTSPSGGGSSANNGTVNPAVPAPSADATAIATRLNAAIVDVNVQLADGEAAGTGMLLSASGVVLTNNHVIENATSISVQIDGGTGASYKADVVGYDVSDDVAVLQLQKASGLKTLTLGDSSKVAVNDTVIAIGNALGKSGLPSVTQGTITALDQTITAGDGSGHTETLRNTFQFDASILPGDSGGPLVDTRGNVIGMITAGSASARRQSATTEAFAIPINNAKAIVDQITSGKASATIHIGPRALLGVELQDTSGAVNGGRRSRTTTTTGSGAIVSGVQDNTPASSAGIVAGDTIVSIGGQTITSANDVSAVLNPRHPGDNIDIGWVDQSGQQHHANVKLIAGPPA